MSYATVKAHVRDVTHDPNIPSSRFDIWNAEVASELTVRLLSNDRNDGFVVTTAGGVNPFFVGLANGEVFEVTATNSAGKRYSLQNASRKTVIDWITESGDPKFYNQEGDTIRIAPFSNGVEIRGRFRARVTPFTDNSDSTAEFNTYPQVYYYAFLKRAFEWMQDYESAALYRQLFEEEVQRIERREKRISAGTNRASRGAWSWV